MLHSRQRFGATAVAQTGGVINSKLKTGVAGSSFGSHQKNLVNPAKLAERNAFKSKNIQATSETKSKSITNSSETKTSLKTLATTTTPTPETTTSSTETTSSSSLTANNTNDPIQPCDDDIVIHVCDESRKVNRDFKCSKKLLLKEMKYFESYLSSSNQYDDIDISVHCDVYIFEWLMRFINRPENPPELKCKSAVSILISSEFLRMQRLVDLCLEFVHTNINEVIKLPIDLNCINSNLISRLSLLFTITDLEKIDDRRDKLKSKLWMKSVEKLLENKKNVLQCCSECGKIYSKSYENILTCKKSRPYIDFHGNVISNHTPLTTWKMRSYVQNMRSSKKMEWRLLYWKLYGMFHILKCIECNDYFPICEFGHCVYHPKEPVFGNGLNRGEYNCCGELALRFDTTMRKSGCRAKNHTPEEMIFTENNGTEDNTTTTNDATDSTLAAATTPPTIATSPSTTTTTTTTADTTAAAATATTVTTATTSTNEVINTLIQHLDLITVTFTKDTSSNGYEEDRLAGLVNGNKSGAAATTTTGSSKKDNKDTGDSKHDFNTLPRRPKNNRSSRPSTANNNSTNRGRNNNNNNNDSSFSSNRPSTAGRYGRNNDNRNNDTNTSTASTAMTSTTQAFNDTYRGGVVSYSSTSRRGSTVIAGQSVTTPEAFRVNPQRRRMWKLDLQRETDTVRMNALVNKLETLRNDEQQENAHQFKLYSF